MCSLLRSAVAISLAALIWSGPVLAGNGGMGPSMPGQQTTSDAGSAQAGADWVQSSNASPYANLPGPAARIADTAPASTDIGGAGMPPATSGLRSWNRGQGRWSFGSLATAPDATRSDLSGLESDALGINPANGVEGNDSGATVPVIASYRLSRTDRLAFSYEIPVAAKSFQYARRASTASDIWTVAPRVAYTRVVSGSNGDSSTVFAMGLFSKKNDAMYRNGFVGRFETMLMKETSSGWGVGGVAAAMEQPTQDVPSSMVGRGPNYGTNGGLALGVGPQVTWGTHWLGSKVEFRSRWIYEFRGPNGHTDQPIMLTATLRP